MKKVLFILLIILTAQFSYSQVSLNANDVVIATTARMADSGMYFVVTGPDNLTLVNGYAGGRYTVYGWLGPFEDPRLENLVDLGGENYNYEWSIEGMGTTCYVSGFGRFADVSVYSNSHGSVRVICEITSSSGGYLDTAIGYVNF